MKRRDFITLAGGAAVWPLKARAQPAPHFVGWMHGGSAAPNTHLVEAFRAGLADTGYAEGRNVQIDFRWADGRYEDLPKFAADFTARTAAVIAAIGNVDAARAAMQATSTIPIVFANAADPVDTGLVSRIDRPQGNATGVTYFTSLMGPKRLELLGEIVPPPANLGLLVNPRNSITPAEVRKLRDAARALGRKLEVYEAASPEEIDAAFERAKSDGVAAMMPNTDAYFTSLRDTIVAIAAKYSIPTAYHVREFAVAGGLMSYGDKRSAEYRDVGRYVGKLLSGVKVADLPVLQPTTFELVINLKTAKALGMTISESFLVRADEVIE